MEFTQRPTHKKSQFRKHIVLTVLAFMFVTMFSANAFAATSPIQIPIPPTTPNSVFYSAAQCGYFPTSNSPVANKWYFTAEMDGTKHGVVNLTLNVKPTSVTRDGGIDNNAFKLLTATPGVKFQIDLLGLNRVKATFPAPEVSGGSLTFDFGTDGYIDHLSVSQSDSSGTWLGGVSAGTSDGKSPYYTDAKGPYGGVGSTINVAQAATFYGGQGLFLPVKRINYSTTFIPNSPRTFLGSSFFQDYNRIVGSNSMAKSTEKLLYVLPNKTGCDATSYIEIK